MTDSTTPRKILTAVAPVSWEHPADRAALQTLRSVPGVDDAFRKILGIAGGERGVRLMFQANAVRVGPSQLAKLWGLHLDVCSTLDWPAVPELFVSQRPAFNAGTYGVDRPFIVIHTSALELLDEAELRTLLGHELGHVMSGHALYRTMAAILLSVSLGALPALTGLALAPIRFAILEWARKAELSSDRAGLLAAQDPAASRRLYMKMAGGLRASAIGGDLDADAFMAQAHEYSENKDLLQQMYRILFTLDATHPMHVVRAAEVQEWTASGAYDRILAGDYTRRGQEERERPLREDLQDAARHYSDEARQAIAQVVDAAADAAAKLAEALRKRGPAPS